MTDQTERVLVAARAIALLYGDEWDTLDAEARLHYRKEGFAVVTALAKHDKGVRSKQIRAGWAKSDRAGLRSVGRPRLPSDKENQARAMILAKQTTRAIRDATGLGNSTISRIKSDIQRGHADAPSNHPDSAVSAAASVPL
jgi:DNA invertase Pin-like site-specific DNA recombinase